ncbi:protein-l-isoaspartate o-methyltransferase,putative [Leishmania mexicana MHOM/GT/2001/U1103]|uniref:protein-L-isoaspartate(D-aspartate) O-methyltransferase n=1 Tax=Leishmania mexicana (strain MHOM/GT/2001/U1103) TaxID=929439 RepID=E9AU91_LEIMU|nr:protein-l-isoaspartate o-methyltransferase,putative [Leishmania mexicana MHOM/GT/2001/U1103]CBZ26517.1 protein-l-isoaspartate o-methyltransferase,putative [Leishmania mexicana MHOM/GT/2001/U1103]
MAWHCSSTTNAGMVAALQREGLIKTPEVIEVMRRVDRGWFVRNPKDAYRDQPLPIGFGVTISAPHMHAIMLELVCPSVLRHKNLDRARCQSLRLLDIGSGSGYMTAAFAALCEAVWRDSEPPTFEVVGIEHVQELQKQSKRVLESHFPDWIREHRVTLLHGDGRKPRSIAGLGEEKGECFDVIHVGATAPKTLVPEYLSLLRCGGTLVIPVGSPAEVQELQVFTKGDEGAFTMRRACHVQFVPLTSLHAQLDGDVATRT